MFNLLKSIKTRDAALLFCWLQRQTGGVGETRRTSCDNLAAWMNADGLKTSRGAFFTAAVVRARLAELEAVEVIAINNADEPGIFSVMVYHPAPMETVEPNEEEGPKMDLYAGRSLFHFENENENENRSKKSAHNKEYINKKINNLETSKSECLTEKQGRASTPTTPPKVVEQNHAVERVHAVESTDSTEPTTAALTPEEATGRIDFTAPKVAAFRAKISAIVWDPYINPELIDRLVAAAILRIGGLDWKGALSLARDASDARELYRRTDGRAGKKFSYQSLGYAVKRLYETNGYTWTPTAIAQEPAPAALKRVVFSQTETTEPDRPTTAKQPADTLEELEAAAHGFTVDALDMDRRDFEREVSKRLKTRPGIETQAKALTIRTTLRQLKDYYAETYA